MLELLSIHWFTSLLSVGTLSCIGVSVVRVIGAPPHTSSSSLYPCTSLTLWYELNGVMIELLCPVWQFEVELVSYRYRG